MAHLYTLRVACYLLRICRFSKDRQKMTFALFCVRRSAAVPGIAPHFLAHCACLGKTTRRARMDAARWLRSGYSILGLSDREGAAARPARCARLGKIERGRSSGPFLASWTFPAAGRSSGTARQACGPPGPHGEDQSHGRELRQRRRSEGAAARPARCRVPGRDRAREILRAVPRALGRAVRVLDASSCREIIQHGPAGLRPVRASWPRSEPGRELRQRRQSEGAAAPPARCACLGRISAGDLSRRSPRPGRFRLPGDHPAGE